MTGIRRMEGCALALMTLLAGCSTESGESPYTVLDSAGVQIVESHRYLWQPGEEWSIAPEPILEIGTREGDGPYQFHEITGGIRLPDGRLVISNSGSMQIRVFSGDGSFLTEFGGPGDGPGEFRRLSDVHYLPGDSLLVFDSRHPGLSVFSSDGTLVRTVRIAPPGSEDFESVFPMTSDRLVVSTYASVLTGAGEPSLGVHRYPAPLLSYSPDGVLQDTLGFFPSTETMVIEVGGGVGTGAPPFTKWAHFGVQDGAIYVGTAEELEISVLAASGDLSAVYRFPNIDLTVQQKDRDWYADRLREAASNPQEVQMVDMMLGALPFPETRAAYNGMKIANDGTIWLRTGREAPMAPHSREWTVISRDGVFLGEVVFPERFRPLEFGADDVLGVWQDELDVEFIRIYRIVKR